MDCRSVFGVQIMFNHVSVVASMLKRSFCFVINFIIICFINFTDEFLFKNCYVEVL